MWVTSQIMNWHMYSTRILVRKDVCDGRALNKTASIMAGSENFGTFTIDIQFFSLSAADQQTSAIILQLAARFHCCTYSTSCPTPSITKRYSCLNRQLHLLLSTIVENCLPRSIWCHLLLLASSFDRVGRTG